MLTNTGTNTLKWISKVLLQDVNGNLCCSADLQMKAGERQDLLNSCHSSGCTNSIGV